MKKLAIAFGTIFMAMTSCQKEGTTTTEDDTAVVSDFLKMAANSTAVTTCAHADSTDSLHRQRHHHLNVTEVDIITLPTSIAAYIITNYQRSTINKAGVDSLGNYYIKVLKADSTYVGLQFDANGNFVKELIRGHHRDRENEIAISTLPAAISTYIASNYTAATTHRAILETDGTYKIILIQSDGTLIGLAFDANGNFVSTMTVKDKHGKKRRKH